MADETKPLFPFFGDTAVIQETKELPLYREVAWDFQNNVPKMENGDFILLEGAEAVRVWCYKALVSERYRYEIYSYDYGSQLSQLISKSYSPNLTKAEALRYLEECLLINPYVTGIVNGAVSFEKGKLTITAELETVYGKTELEVSV